MLKYPIYILVIFLWATSATGQGINQENVPAVVLNSFQVRFPNAKDIRWTIKDGEYQAKCKINEKENKVTIDYKGRVLKHQQDLYLSEIPDPVLKTIRSKVDFFDLGDADKIDEKDKIVYEIDFETDGKRHYFRIDDKGHLIKYRKELKDSEIPVSILNFIQTKFGRFDRIDRAKYVEENGKIYYIVAGKGHIFLFDDKVKLLEHHQDLQESKIPAPVMHTIRESYKGYDIKDADLKDKRGVVTYTLRMWKSGKNVFVTLSPEGKILDTK